MILAASLLAQGGAIDRLADFAQYLVLLVAFVMLGLAPGSHHDPTLSA